MPLRFVGARTFAAHAVQVPSLGDSVPNGTILTLGKTPGQAVQVDDVIAVIETDKVSPAVPPCPRMAGAARHGPPVPRNTLPS